MPNIVEKRPNKRSDCLQDGLNSQRPCPWVGCRWHILTVYHPTAAPWRWPPDDHKGKRNYGGVIIDDDRLVDYLSTLKETCVLDMADKGGLTLEEIADSIGLCRERIRQLSGSIRGKNIKTSAIKSLFGVQKLRAFVERNHSARKLILDGLDMITPEVNPWDGVVESANESTQGEDIVE